MNLRKAAKMALEALEPDTWESKFVQQGKRAAAREALRQALAQQEQYDQTALELCDVCGWKSVIPDEGCLVCARKNLKPVAWMYEWLDEWNCWNKTAHLHKPSGSNVRNVQPLYTTLRKRKWVDVSQEELIKALEEANLPSVFSYRMACKVALDIAKEKNYTTIQQPDEFCTATTEELMKALGCSDEKAREIHDKIEALAQPEHDPVAYVSDSGSIAVMVAGTDIDDDTPLYTAPPKREWVGLTENEFEEVLKQNNEAFPFAVYKQLEAKLKEKNG